MKLTLSILAGLTMTGLMATPTDASAHRMPHDASTLDAASDGQVTFDGRPWFSWNRFDRRSETFDRQASRDFVPLRSVTATLGPRVLSWHAEELPRVDVVRHELPPQSAQPIPEPSAAVAFGAGLLLTGFAWRRR